MPADSTAVSHLATTADAHPGARRKISFPLGIAAAALPLLAACQQVPLDRADSLQSYASLAPSNGLATDALVYVDAQAVQAARRIAILPTSFSARAAAVVPAVVHLYS